MTREAALFVVLALGALALALAWWGWRGRVRRYRDIDLPTRPRPKGPALHEFALLYVATTEAQKPLERVAIAPLAFRSKALLSVYSDAFVVDLRGEGELVVGFDQVHGVGRATWTIDKVVEPEGLILVRFDWGPLRLESYFRAVDVSADEVIEALGRGHHAVAGEEIP